MTLAVQTILDELTQLHRERPNEASAATMTIVVFFEDETIGALARERIHVLASKHPSRVIVLDATAAETVRRVEERDWIELGVKSADAEVVRSAVAALRLPEAPVILLWIAPGIGDDDRFCQLSPEARTIVYNSSLVHEGGESLDELAAYSQRHPELALADIAYLRLAPWQESVAIFFDGRVEELPDMRRVEIACGSDPEGFYLLGWLASRLRWRPGDGDTLIDEAGNRIEFAISREGEPRRIRRVALTTKHATFVAEVDRRGETISLSVTGHGEQPRYRAVNNPGIAALVERAILGAQRSRLPRSTGRSGRNPCASKPASMSERGDLQVCADSADLAQALADLIVTSANTAVVERGAFHIALSGGTTPKAAYELLAGNVLRAAVPWEKVSIYFGDERCVPPDDERSNYRMASRAFLDAVPIPRSNIHRIRGEIDPGLAANEYASALRADFGSTPQFDLILLGLGEDGHTASLFPGSDPDLDDGALVRAVYAQEQDMWRVTITPAVINGARRVAFAVEGTAKAPVLAAVYEGPRDPITYPAQIVEPASGGLTWLVDEAAASMLHL